MATRGASGARPDVLEFYRELPFNYRADASVQADAVRRRNALLDYPPLTALLGPGTRLLDVGSGAGWLVNSAAHHHRARAQGIDFNPVAVERAREVAALLGNGASFEVADLFTHRPEEPFELVTSVGVLHHTDDCIGAIRRVAGDLVAPGGRFFLGLYHTHGRRPFLRHFEDMRAAGRSDDEMFDAFRRLRGSGGTGFEDEVFLRSWFRDQVLHPHETQHTLEEVLPVLDACGFELESTSINRFGRLTSREALFAEERRLDAASRQALAEGRYFPGFFVLLARMR